MTTLDRVLQRSQAWQFWQFVANRAKPEAGPVVLTQKRVYILPTRHGYTFALALVLMLIGSINYSLSLGFILTFLLGGMGVVSILHTYRNLAQLEVAAGRVDAAFAGGEAVFRLDLGNPSAFARWSVVAVREAARTQGDVPARGHALLALPVPAAQRGWLPLGRVTLETRFPLGLLRAWSYVQLDARALVYPRPDDAPLPALTDVPNAGDALSTGAGTDDFAGLRAHTPSDSPRHIAWKSVARGSTLLTKTFHGHAVRELWLDFDQLPAKLDVEQRLSRLTRWVVDAEEAGVAYGLRLGGVELGPATGDAHRDACLKALALYGLPA
jgi:uncharacterized protein (DUF58 family)